jgi:hypothetical protein
MAEQKAGGQLIDFGVAQWSDPCRHILNCSTSTTTLDGQALDEAPIRSHAREVIATPLSVWVRDVPEPPLGGPAQVAVSPLGRLVQSVTF